LKIILKYSSLLSQL